MKISIHRNKLRFVLYIKLTCTWFEICILIRCRVIVRFYYKRNTANSLPLYIIIQMHPWNEQILKLTLKLAERCAVSGCWPSCGYTCSVGCLSSFCYTAYILRLQFNMPLTSLTSLHRWVFADSCLMSFSRWSTWSVSRYRLTVFFLIV